MKQNELLSLNSKDIATLAFMQLVLKGQVSVEKKQTHDICLNILISISSKYNSNFGSYPTRRALKNYHERF